MAVGEMIARVARESRRRHIVASFLDAGGNARDVQLNVVEHDVVDAKAAFLGLSYKAAILVGGKDGFHSYCLVPFDGGI